MATEKKAKLSNAIQLHEKPFEQKAMPKQGVGIFPMSKKEWFATMTPNIEEGQSLTIVEGKTKNALFDAFYHAYNTHGGVSLRPEDIYGVFMNTVSRFINAQYERYKDKIYGKTAEFILLDVPGQPDWPKVIDEYLANFKQEYLNTVSAEFSTSTPIDKLITKCYIMDTVKSIAPLQLNTLCGIKFVKLSGTSADWKKLKEKIVEVFKFLKNYHFGYYIDQITPILETIYEIKVKQEKNEEITQKMKEFLSSSLTIGYKRESGRELEFDGWMCKFITTTTEYMVKPATHYNQVLPSYVQVPIKWTRMGQNLNLTCQAGPLGVTYDSETQTFSTVHGVRIYE